MSNKCTFVNPNSPRNSTMNYSTNKVHVSNFTKLPQSNFHDYKNPLTFPGFQKFQKSSTPAFRRTSLSPSRKTELTGNRFPDCSNNFWRSVPNRCMMRKRYWKPSWLWRPVATKYGTPSDLSLRDFIHSATEKTVSRSIFCVGQFTSQIADTTNCPALSNRDVTLFMFKNTLF